MSTPVPTSALSTGVVFSMPASPIVTSPSPAGALLYPHLGGSDSVHDLEDKCYQSALEMVRVQRDRATRLASDPPAELENVRAVLAVDTATASQRGARLHAARDEMAHLRDDLAHCHAEAGTVAVLHRDVERPRAQFRDKDVEIARLRGILPAIRESAAAWLPLIDYSSSSSKSFFH